MQVDVGSGDGVTPEPVRVSHPASLDLVARAIAAALGRRGTAVPAGLPIALTPELSGDDAKQRQWNGFVRKLRVEGVGAGSLGECASEIQAFVGPTPAALAERRPFARGGGRVSPPPWHRAPGSPEVGT